MLNQMANKMAVSSLSEWLLEEIRRRDVSVRQFARLADLNHTTLLRILTPEKLDDYPSVATLIKLATLTHTDLCTLIALISPDTTKVDPEAYLLAQRISQLPPAKQELIDTFIMGVVLKGNE